MWQVTTSNSSKYQHNDPIDRIIKRNSYSLKEHHDIAKTVLSPNSRSLNKNIPHPPIPSLFDARSITSTQSAYTFIPSYKYMSAHQLPPQINANSHEDASDNQYAAYPSTYTIQYQASKSHKRAQSNYSHMHKKKKLKNHKRTKSKIRLQKTSIPPPPAPVRVPASVSISGPQQMIKMQVPKALRAPQSVSISVSNATSSAMEPIPEEQYVNNAQSMDEEKIGLKCNSRTNGLRKETAKPMKSVPNTKSNSYGSGDGNSSNNNKRMSVISMNPMSKRDRLREEIRDKNILNDSFWEQNRKIPFIGLAMTTSTFLILIFIYFTNLYRLLFGGLVPCVISLLIILPIYYFFKKYDVALKYKTIAIRNHIEEENFLLQENGKLYVTNRDLMKENEDLSNNLLLRCNEIQKQKKKMYELSKIIAAKQAQSICLNEINHKNKGEIVKKKPVKSGNLLDGFRAGQMETQLQEADIDDLVHMLPIVASCITLLPFGMTETRKKLQRILERRISDNLYLRMQFYFFLVSFLGCLDVKRLFRKHKLMKLVNETSSYYAYSWDCDENIGDRVYSIARKDSVLSDETNKTITTIGTTTPKDCMLSPTTQLQIAHQSLPLPPINIHSNSNQDLLEPEEEKCQETVIYTEKDPVKLFRMPLDRNAAVGFKVIVPKNLQKRFFDPINGSKCVQQLQVRKIFNSKAKPYLVDCYVNGNTKDDIILSSAYILKRGDDLRKDGAVLKMFEFMNCIWKADDLKYKDSFISSLTYKCIPIGPDVGIIEAIPNCIELNKVMSLRQILSQEKNIDLWNRLVASSAGAFISAFIMGIRDRHDDNILINISTQDRRIGFHLFHIDFGYMFGDRVPLDTAKLAITSGLKNIFDIYHNGWNDFIHICIQSWLILRKNANEIIDYARCVFAFLYQTNQIEMYLRQSLKLDIIDDEIASKYIHDKLKNAPKHLKTKVKNLVHGFAQKIKSNNGVIATQPSSFTADY